MALVRRLPGRYPGPASRSHEGAPPRCLRATRIYLPDKHPLPGSMGSGVAVFRFQGLYNFSQLISSISKVYS